MWIRNSPIHKVILGQDVWSIDPSTSQKNEFWHENSNFISFQGHCQAYEYGSNGCTTNEYEYSAGQYYNHASGHLIMSLPLTLLFVICARLL